MINYWLASIAIALETGGVLGLLSTDAGNLHLVGYLIAHALACALLAIILLPLMPARYRGQPTRTLLFLFTLQFAIPFIGSLGLLGGILLALYLPRSTREVPWQEVDIPELPFQPIDLSLQVIYSQGGLRQVLREASNPDKRLRALTATRHMNDRDAVDILREALKDPTDDVRLLAYSMLEQKEKTLAHRAGLLQQALQNPDDNRSPIQRRRLAQTWWEMAYLGLAQGGLKHYYLNSARALLEDLVSEHGRHNDWRLLGRAHLALDNISEAEAAFEAALAGGAAPELILPYLGEVAFLKRDFHQVRAHLAAIPRERYHPANRAIVEGWL